MALPKLIRSLVLLQCAYFLVSSEWIDMSYLYDNKTLTWGDSIPFKHTVVLDGKFNEHVPYLSMFNLEMSEHSGTHVDAPLHFAKGKWSVDEIPLEHLIGEALLSTSQRKHQRTAMLNSVLKICTCGRRNTNEYLKSAFSLC